MECSFPSTALTAQTSSLTKYFSFKYINFVCILEICIVNMVDENSQILFLCFRIIGGQALCLLNEALGTPAQEKRGLHNFGKKTSHSWSNAECFLLAKPFFISIISWFIQTKMFTFSGPTMKVTSHISGRWARNPRSAIRLVSSWQSKNRCSDRSMEVNLPALLGYYDRQTNRPNKRPTGDTRTGWVLGSCNSKKYAIKKHNV